MKTVVIMPGGFHPFHAGHYSLYNAAKQAFPGADVYVAATNDTSTRPFPFAVKEKLAQLAGVDAGRFVQVKSPFRAEEITQKYDPDNTVLIFVRSEKDATTPPRPGGIKKDGSPSYLQPMGRDLKPMTQHAYMAYLPTVEFGPGITSASEIRAAWPRLDDRRKTAMVMSLYPRTQKNPQLAATVVKMLDAAIGTENVAEEIKSDQFADTGDAFTNGQYDAMNFLPKNIEKYTLKHKYRSRYSQGYKYGEMNRDRSIDPRTRKPYIKFGAELAEQPNQAGVGANVQAAVANTQPQTAATTTAAAPAAKPSMGTTQAAAPKPSVGSTQPAAAQTTTPATTSTATAMQPNSNVVNLAKRLGVDPRRLQGELQNMQEDYLDEKRR